MTLRAGDRIKVAPSQPNKKDGWVGAIVSMFRDAGGIVIEVTHPAASARYVKIERIKGRVYGPRK